MINYLRFVLIFVNNVFHPVTSGISCFWNPIPIFNGSLQNLKYPGVHFPSHKVNFLQESFPKLKESLNNSVTTRSLPTAGHYVLVVM